MEKFILDNFWMIILIISSMCFKSTRQAAFVLLWMHIFFPSYDNVMIKLIIYIIFTTLSYSMILSDEKEAAKSWTSFGKCPFS